jgi:hypothetical protein
MATFPSKVDYTTGEVLTAQQMNDIGGAINLLDGAQFAAGKNKIINGDFGVWQRGTSFSNPANEAYLADRFNIVYDGSGSTRTISRQTQTPGAISGYEYPYFFRFAQSVAGTAGTYVGINQRIEGVETLAGQTATLSFWAKADATRTLLPNLQQNFGSGGSTTVNITSGFSTLNLTTSWVRYTATISIPSISGKTVGTSSFLQLFFGLAANTVQTVDIFGVQLEAASTASNFQTATGTKQGELAACQRYYFRFAGGQTFSRYGTGYSSNTNTAFFNLPLPVSLRVSPTAVDYSTLILDNGFGTSAAVTAVTLTANCQSPTVGSIGVNVASGLTADRNYQIENNGSTAGYIGFTAEL